MKIVILHPFQFRLKRGIEQFTWSIMKAFAQEGAEVDLITWDFHNPAKWEELPENCHVYRIPSFRYYQAFFAGWFDAYFLLRRDYDWVIIFFAGYGEARAINLVRRLKTLRLAIVFHFPVELVPHRFKEFEQSGLIQFAEQIFTVSDYAAQGIEARYQRPCTVIHNGVDPERYKPSSEARLALRAQLGVLPESPVLITTAAFEERKGIQWMIRALPALLRHYPTLEYWVLGEGDYRSSLEQEIKTLGLEKHVRLLGRVDDVIPYLAAADIGCLLSYGESFGISVIEYMAMELPTVASQHAPFDQIVQPAWGITVAEKATAEVANQIAALLGDPARRLEMGRQGRQEVLARYTWEIAAKSYLARLS